MNLSICAYTTYISFHLDNAFIVSCFLYRISFLMSIFDSLKGQGRRPSFHSISFHSFSLFTPVQLFDTLTLCTLSIHAADFPFPDIDAMSILQSKKTTQSKKQFHLGSIDYCKDARQARLSSFWLTYWLTADIGVTKEIN